MDSNIFKYRDFVAFVVGFNNGLGWRGTTDCRIVKKHQSYWFINDFSKLEETKPI